MYSWAKETIKRYAHRNSSIHPRQKQPVNAIASRDLTLQRRTGNSGLYELRAVGTVPDILDSIEEFHAGMTGTSVGLGAEEATQTSTQTPKKRKISAAGRQRIAEAVRARHAAKKQQQGAEGKTEPVAKHKKPKTMSANA